MNNNIFSFKIIIIGLFFSLTACHKKNQLIPIPPISKDSLTYIDYSKFDFEQMAALSGRFIVDTIWDAKRHYISGFTLGKKAKHFFQYPDSTYTKLPWVSSFIILNHSRDRFDSEKYRKESAGPIERLQFNAYNSNPISVESFTGWESLDVFVKKNFQSLEEQNYYGYKNRSGLFHNYENLKLFFDKQCDVKAMFKISTQNYPKLNNIGIWYYTESNTFDINSDIYDYDFTDHIPQKDLTNQNIARVKQIEYGKVAYMILDGPSEIKNMMNRMISPQGISKLTVNELQSINNAEVYFYQRGYSKEEWNNVQKFQSTAEKINAFFELTSREVQNKTFMIHGVSPTAMKVRGSSSQ